MYRHRRDVLINALADRFDVVRDVAGIAAGLHVLIRLDPTVVTSDADEWSIADAARAAGLDAQPLCLYRHEPGPAGLVLGYRNSTPDQLRHAVGSFLDR